MTRGDWFIAVSIVVEITLLVVALQLGTGLPLALLDWLPQLNFAGGVVAILVLGVGFYRFAAWRWGR